MTSRKPKKKKKKKEGDIIEVLENSSLPGEYFAKKIIEKCNKKPEIISREGLNIKI